MFKISFPIRFAKHNFHFQQLFMYGKKQNQLIHHHVRNAVPSTNCNRGVLPTYQRRHAFLGERFCNQLRHAFLEERFCNSLVKIVVFTRSRSRSETYDVNTTQQVGLFLQLQGTEIESRIRLFLYLYVFLVSSRLISPNKDCNISFTIFSGRSVKLRIDWVKQVLECLFVVGKSRSFYPVLTF